MPRPLISFDATLAATLALLALLIALDMSTNW